MQSILSAQGVCFEFANGRTLFHNLNFSLDAQLFALVGPNGIGKTTLAKLLIGELTPTRGTLRRNGAVTFFAQRETPPAETVAQYLAPHYAWSALSEALLAKINWEVPCNALSGGEWMRVRLARTLDDAFLILDEPTNDLDQEGRRALMHFLQERNGGGLLISHDRACLQLCDHVLELSNRGLTKFGGSWQDYLLARETERRSLERALEQAKQERDAALIARREKVARQDKRNRQGAAAAARSGMPKILLGGRKRRAQETTGKVDVETLERNELAVRNAHAAYHELKIDPVMYADLIGQKLPNQKLVAEAVEFNICFADWLFPRNLNFCWRGNIRIAIQGSNGSGKSTLLRAILGSRFMTRGKLSAGPLEALYVDQRCDLIDDKRTVLENVRAFGTLTETEARNGLAKFLFTKESVFRKATDLSGGERLRLTLARGFLQKTKPQLLVLDEPTNNLDLVNIEFLERLVREFPGAVIAVSHDEVFLKNCGITEFFGAQ